MDKMNKPVKGFKDMNTEQYKTLKEIYKDINVDIYLYQIS